jgi:hypothetical protein
MINTTVSAAISSLQLSQAQSDSLERSVGSNANNTRNDYDDDLSNDPTQFDIFHWGGRFHYVPESFKFPSVNTKTMWDLMHFGNASLKIRPYKKIRVFSLQTKAERTNFTNAKKVVSLLQAFAKQKNFLQEGEEQNISLLPTIQSNAIFAASFPELIKIAYKKPPHRPDEIMYGTIARRLRNLQNGGESEEEHSAHDM